MVIASDFAGLHAWAQAMAVILLLELIVLLLIVAALTLVLMLGARWLQRQVVPLLNATVPRAKQALDLTNQGTNRVVRGVAEVHGWRSALEAGFRVFFQRGGEPGAAAAPGAQDGARAAAAGVPHPFDARPNETAREQDERMPPPAAHAG